MSPDSSASWNAAKTTDLKRCDADEESAIASGSVVDALPGLVWTARLDGHVDFLNKRWFEFTGLNSDEVYGHGWQTAIHPEDRPAFLERWRSILASGQPGEMAARLRRFDGEYRRFLFRACPLADASGKFVKWCGINTDVEDQKPAEDTAALKRSEARKAAILDAALDCIVTINHEGCITEFNPAAQRTFGFSRDQVMGKPLADVIIPPSFREQHRRGFARFLATGEARVVGRRIEITAVRADGKEFPVELAITRIPWEGPPSFTGYLRDITESKQREEELRRTAAYLAEAQKLSLTGSFGWSISNGEIFWSDETYSILKIDRGTTPSIELALTRVHPDDIALFNQTLSHAAEEETELDFEHRLLLPDGAVKHVHVVAHALDHSPGGKEFIGAVMDVTTHHEARMALEKALSEIKKSEQSLRLIVDNLPGLVCSMSAAGEVETVNPQVTEYTGKTVVELKNLASLAHPDDLARVASQWSRSLETGCPLDVEYRIPSASGENRWFRVRGLAAKDAEGNILRWYVSLIDIEVRKRAEASLSKTRAELAHVTRMTTMGELAASIAHEVNQPLAAVVTNAEACMRFLNRPEPDFDEIRAGIRSIIRDGNRGGEVIARIRAFLKKEQPVKAWININETVGDVVKLAQFELSDTDLQVELTEHLPSVSADRVQIQQVLINLIVNALDAMKSVSRRARTLRIETKKHEGDAVSVAVQDSGVGFPPEKMEQLFETFYTTKSNGLGMGLSISHSIIESHGGRLWAKRNDGPGATFQFILPAQGVA